MLQSLDHLQKRVDERIENGLYRKLPVPSSLVDFCSNDYLGFSRCEELKNKLVNEYNNFIKQPLGSTGSRLLTGNSEFAEDLERDIAAYHDVDTALLFSTGYQANLGLFSCLLQKGDTLITDEHIHSSVIDGYRMTFAKRLKFNHNDLNHLESKLKFATGTCYVAIESIYSMDGDFAPLTAIYDLCQQYGALLIVDEAHAFGVFGKGLVHQAGLNRKIFAQVVTYGKALGAHGATVLGSQLLHTYLINFSRSFIYSTAMSFLQLLHIKTAYQHLEDHPEKQMHLQKNIQYYLKELSNPRQINDLESPIQTLIIPGNQAVKQASKQLENLGFAVYPILSPTVKKGQERLRICIHSHNTRQEIERLCHSIRKNNW